MDIEKTDDLFQAELIADFLAKESQRSVKAEEARKKVAKSRTHLIGFK